MLEDGLIQTDLEWRPGKGWQGACAAPDSEQVKEDIQEKGYNKLPHPQASGFTKHSRLSSYRW